MTDPVTAYARRVMRGRVPAGHLLRLACERHLEDLTRAKARGLVWDRTCAIRRIGIASSFVQFKGEWSGRPLDLQPWQQFIYGSLTGWKRADGTRRFRTAFIEVPRGQGKSTMAGALALDLTFLEGEPGADSYTVATKRDQARVVFEAARQMVLRTPALKRRVQVMNHNLHQLESASKLEPLGADANTLDGLRPHVVIADEVHAHVDSSVINVMLTGMGTRRQPLLFEITTAGTNRQGPWWAHREYSRQVLDGRHEDDSWFTLIACADDGDDWTDPAVWRKANPNYGVSVKPEFLRIECRKAQAMAVYQNDFRRLHVGQLVEQDRKVVDRRRWDACRRETTWESLRGRPCYAGLDLSTTTDLSALTLVFPDDDGGVTLWPIVWVPDLSMRDRVQRDKVPYDVWAQQGFLRVTAGNVTDYDTIRHDIAQIARQVRIVEIGFDPWNATQLAVQLMADFGSDAIVEVRQGYRTLSEPTKRLLAMIDSGAIRHPGHPVLSWAADNLAVAMDPAGNMKPDKSRATERIDPMVAAIMGLSRWMVRQQGGATYETRELFVI